MRDFPWKMQKSNPSLGKQVPLTTTPVSSSYKDSSTVYRSLLAAPAPLDIGRPGRVIQKSQEGGLVGLQSKGDGQFIWTETKQVATLKSEKHPCPIPLIVANAPANTLFVESQPVSKVIVAIQELFHQHDVDATFDQSKFKWKCVCYSSNVETCFVARLFSVPNKPNFFVLDFQRRSGDPFHFQSIYRALNFRLLKSGFMVCNEERQSKELSAPEFRTFQPLQLPLEFKPVVDHEESATDLEPVIRMCTSPYIDVQREGLIALASSIVNDTSKVKLVPPGFPAKALELVALTRDDQVKRLATSVLAILSSDESVAQELANRGAARVFVAIVMNSSDCMETRRKAAAVLLNVPVVDSYSLASLKGMVDVSVDPKLNALLTAVRAKYVIA